MSDKLKSWGAAAKEFLLWVAMPAIALIGFFFYIMSENSNLKEEVARKSVERDLAEADQKASDAEKEGNDEETKFNNAYDQLDAHYADYTRSGVVSPVAVGGNVSGAAGSGRDPKEG